MKPTKEKILKKYTFGDPAKLWADDAEKAMQEYAESYHKEKLRDELITYDEWYYSTSFYDIKDLITEQLVDKYLKQKQ